MRAFDFDRSLSAMEASLNDVLDEARALSARLDAITRPSAISDDAWRAWRVRFSALCDRGVCELVDLDVEAQFDAEA